MRVVEKRLLSMSFKLFTLGTNAFSMSATPMGMWACAPDALVDVCGLALVAADTLVTMDGLEKVVSDTLSSGVTFD